MNINTRICMVVQNYFPEDPRVRKYVNSLSKSGYKVDIISLKEPNMKFKERYQNGTIYRIGIPKKRATILRYLLEYLIFFISSFLFLNFLFLKKGYSIIHVHNMPDFLVFVAILPKILGAKVILDMHEITPELFRFKYGLSDSSLFIRILKIIEYCSLNFADYIITVTDKIKEIFTQRDNIENIAVIMNTYYYLPENKIKKIKTEYFEMVYLGFIGDLYSLDLTIKALSLIKGTNIKLRFNIFGEGPSRNDLEKLTEKLGLKNTVIFHDRISHNELERVFRRMLLGIHILKKTQCVDLSFTNKLSDYVNHCVPVLTTRIPAILDYFDENDLFFCEDNVESIQEKLSEIIQGKVDLKKKALSAKRKYKKIAWDNMERKYLSIINNLSNS